MQSLDDLVSLSEQLVQRLDSLGRFEIQELVVREACEIEVAIYLDKLNNLLSADRPMSFCLVEE